MSRLTRDGRRAARAAVIVAMAVVAAIGVGGERWASAGDDDGAVPLAAPGAPSVIVPVEPARILDTRTGVGAPAGKVAPGSTITLQVTGAGGVPAGATGVVLNLTATASEGAGYATAYPAGGARPDASVINYSAGEDVANMVTAQLSADGALAIFNDQANVHLVADVAGYLVPGSGSPGPQGAQGPQGPAGPGATVIVNEAVPNPTASLTLGVYAGLTLIAFCNGPATGIHFNATAVGTLRITGKQEFFNGGTPLLQNVVSPTGSTNLTTAGFNQFLFSGVIDAAGVTSSVEIGMKVGSPCIVWGTIIPAG
jgi:hypothetical protein